MSEKGFVFCGSCGEKMNVGVKFCPKCGKPVQPPKPQGETGKKAVTPQPKPQNVQPPAQQVQQVSYAQPVQPQYVQPQPAYAQPQPAAVARKKSKGPAGLLIALIALLLIATLLVTGFIWPAFVPKIVRKLTPMPEYYTKGSTLSAQVNSGSAATIGNLKKNGVKVRLSNGAVLTGTNVKLKVRPTDNISSFVKDGYDIVGSVISLKTDKSSDALFAKPVSMIITLPVSQVDDTSKGGSYFPAYYDKQAKLWKLIKPTWVDLKKGLMEVSLPHPGDVAVLKPSDEVLEQIYVDEWCEQKTQKEAFDEQGKKAAEPYAKALADKIADDDDSKKKLTETISEIIVSEVDGDAKLNKEFNSTLSKAAADVTDDNKTEDFQKVVNSIVSEGLTEKLTKEGEYSDYAGKNGVIGEAADKLAGGDYKGAVQTIENAVTEFDPDDEVLKTAAEFVSDAANESTDLWNDNVVDDLYEKWRDGFTVEPDENDEAGETTAQSSPGNETESSSKTSEASSGVFEGSAESSESSSEASETSETSTEKPSDASEGSQPQAPKEYKAQDIEAIVEYICDIPRDEKSDVSDYDLITGCVFKDSSAVKEFCDRLGDDTYRNTGTDNETKENVIGHIADGLEEHFRLRLENEEAAKQAAPAEKDIVSELAANGMFDPEVHSDFFGEETLYEYSLSDRMMMLCSAVEEVEAVTDPSAMSGSNISLYSQVNDWVQINEKYASSEARLEYMESARKKNVLAQGIHIPEKGEVTADDIAGVWTVDAQFSNLESPLLEQIYKWIKGKIHEVIGEDFDDDIDEFVGGLYDQSQAQRVKQKVNIEKADNDKLYVTISSDSGESSLYEGYVKNGVLSLKMVKQEGNNNDLAFLQVQRLEYRFTKIDSIVIMEGTYDIKSIVFNATYDYSGVLTSSAPQD